MVSIIIPSCNEKFLKNTLDDIFNKATGRIEVIVGHDEYNSDANTHIDTRVVNIFFPKRIGMRALTNHLAKNATGEYIMKCDAHCAFGKGFDEILASSCQDNWIVVPRQYPLSVDTWDRNKRKKHVDYWYLIAPDESKEASRTNGLAPYRWYARKNANLIDDLMTFQGSCWLMTTTHFKNLGYLDGTNYGYFGFEACELSLKTWLSGGRVVVNKNTWYAHLHKGRKHGRMYFLSKSALHKSAKYNLDLWMNNKWDRAIHDTKWLIDKFSPVPTWDNFNWSKEW